MELGTTRLRTKPAHIPYKTEARKPPAIQPLFQQFAARRLKGVEQRVGRSTVGIFREHIELDFGLGATRAHDNLVAAFNVELRRRLPKASRSRHPW